MIHSSASAAWRPCIRRHPSGSSPRPDRLARPATPEGVSKQVSSSVVVTVQGDGENDALSVANGLTATTNTAGIGPTGQTLSSGANTVNIPAGALGVTIVPPPGNTVALTVKGVSGDTGLPLHLTQPFQWIFPVASPPTTFVINAASSMTAPVRFFWA